MGFDANKSTAKKFKMYNGYVDKLYAMVLKANDMPRGDNEQRVPPSPPGRTSTPTSAEWV